MAEKVTIGNCELWHGDSLEVLPLLPPVDLVLTDPPYGLGKILMRTPSTTTRWSKHFGTGAPEWDKETVDDAVALAIGKGRLSIVWGGQFYELAPARCLLSWNKIIRNWSSSEAEIAWTNLDKPNRCFDYSHGQLATEGKHYHPTQKPVPLMEWCIAQAADVATVCDPFMGSGTTGVACARMGLQFVGIERERKYFDIACERIYNAYRQNTLFGQDENVQEVPASQAAIEFQQE